MAFGHNGTHVFLKNIEGTSGLTLDGSVVEATDWQGHVVANKLPIVAAGDFFDYELHIQKGWNQRMYLYINKILVGNPTFSINTGGTNGNRVLYGSGSSGDTDRHTYVRHFFITINTTDSEIALTKADLETHTSVNLVMQNGTRDYSMVFDKGLNLEIGYTFNILTETIGKISWSSPNGEGLAGTIDGFAEGDIELNGLQEIIKTNNLHNGAQFISRTELAQFEPLRTGLIAFRGMDLSEQEEVEDWLAVHFPARTMRFVDKVKGLSVIVTRASVDFWFTDGLNAPDDLGVVHFYEDIDGNIFGSAKTDWSTPEQRRRYVYLGNADVNETKDRFIQANNPLVSAFGLLDSFGDYLAIGGSIKGSGGKVLISNQSSPLGFDITSYTAVAWGRNFNNPEMPHTPTSPDIVDAFFHLGYRTSDTAMLFGEQTHAIDPLQYQPHESTILFDVPNQKYTIQRVYQFPGTTYNMVVYGSTLYDSRDQAISNAATERYNLHPSLTPACFLAYIVVRKDVTNLLQAINTGSAAILNYDGRMHPSTIGSDQTSILSIEAGGELRSMVDQFANSDVDPIVFIDFEIGNDSLYGCIWDAQYRTLKSVSQKDMVINIVPQVGRRETGTSVGLEIFIDVSYDNGNTWNVDATDTYTTYQSIAGQIDSLTASVLIFRVTTGMSIRIGMMLTSAQDEVGILSHGKGDINPGASTSGRHLPSCILTIT